jgi:hypothetical protein
VAAVVLAGCGSEEGAPARTLPSGATPKQPPLTVTAPPTRLTVTVWPRGEGKAGQRRWTLTCSPAGGTHPTPKRACDALARSPGAMRPVAGDAMCTQIYGGPQQARVQGTFRGRRIESEFGRSNGCELDRWDRLRALFPVRTG